MFYYFSREPVFPFYACYCFISFLNCFSFFTFPILSRVFFFFSKACLWDTSHTQNDSSFYFVQFVYIFPREISILPSARLIFYSQESFYIFSFFIVHGYIIITLRIYNSHCFEYFLKILFFIFSLSHPKLGEDSIKARGCSSSRISTCSKKNGPLSTIGDSNPGFLTRKQVPNSLRHLGSRIDRFLFAIT